MPNTVFPRAEQKRRVTITPELRACVLDALAGTPQQPVARQLNLSQAAVSKIARSAVLAANAERR